MVDYRPINCYSNNNESLRIVQFYLGGVNLLLLPLIVTNISGWNLAVAVVSLLGGLAAIVFGTDAMRERRNVKKAKVTECIKQEGFQEGSFTTQLNTITSSGMETNRSVGILNSKFDVLCDKQEKRDLQFVKELALLEGHINTVDNKAASAHHRLDTTEKRVEKIEDHIWVNAKGSYDVSDAPEELVRERRQT